MVNAYEWKQYREEVQTMGNRMQMNRKSHCIPNGRAARKRNALRGTVLMSLLALGAFAAMFYVIGAFPQAASAQDIMVTNSGAAPAQPGMNLGKMADYLFVLALPFAVGLLVNQCMILKQISSRVRKNG